MHMKIDITGQRFGKLTAVRYRFYPTPKESKWEMKCDCGNTSEVTLGNAKRTKSCGCLKNRLRHGACRRGKMNQLYPVWSAIIQRCTNPRNDAYRYYGGRGIKVCDRWRDFANFYADMGDRPFPSYSIDRKDNDGNYCPENCEWASRGQQAVNRRSGTVVALRAKLAAAYKRIEELEALYRIEIIEV